MDGPGLTWQKVGVIAAILAIILPLLGKGAYLVVFPQYRLVYEVQHPITVPGFSAFAVVITNDGSDREDGVTVVVPPAPFNPAKAYVHVSSPSPYGALGTYPATSADVVSATRDGYSVPVGRLLSGESVRVTFAATTDSGPDAVASSWTLVPGVRVYSKQGGATEGDGMGISVSDDSLHAMLWMMSPYVVALAAAIFLVIIFAGLIFSVAFDSREKQMTRLWKQMDLLQEKIDKERRYK